jgi:PAS domain S-box-containing protein
MMSLQEDAGRQEDGLLLAAEKEAFARLARGEGIGAALDGLLAAVENLAGPELIASVWLVDDRLSTIQFCAGPRVPQAYRRSADGSTLTPDTGSCGRAVATKEPVAVTDVTQSELWLNYADMLVSVGIRASWSTPILSSLGSILGTFAVYYSTPGEPRPDDRRLVERVTQTTALLIERHRSEQALRESEERYRGLVGIMPAAMYACDRQGRITFYNEQASQIWGRAPKVGDDEVRFCGSLKLFLPDGSPLQHDRTPVVDVLRTGVGCRNREVIVERPDGSRSHVLANISAVRDQEGGVAGAVNVFTDITERKQAEEALRAAQERLQRWNVELERAVNEKTAELVQSQERLRALATELNLAEQRERQRLADELHDHLQQMLVLGKLKIGTGKRLAFPLPAVAKAMQQVDDVLTEALQYTRTLVAELSPPVLRDHGLAAGLKWLAESMKKHDLTVTVRVPKQSELKLPEDQTMLLFQSVRELLINSWKHAGTGQATIAMEQRDGRLYIEVRDEGAGFDLAAAAAAAAAAAGMPSGGLSSKFGLFSIRERMKALGGSFDIHSAPGKGTTATLALPLSGKEALSGKALGIELGNDSGTLSAGPQRSTLSDSKLQDAKVRVLLVDDHIMVRQGLRAVLDGYHDIELVGEAADGEEAVCLAKQLSPAVVVMDINMPKMTGIDATSRIKAHRPETVVIGLSVNAGAENQEAMSRAGAALLLTKEAAVEQLYGAIQQAVRPPLTLPLPIKGRGEKEGPRPLMGRREREGLAP